MRWRRGKRPDSGWSTAKQTQRRSVKTVKIKKHTKQTKKKQYREILKQIQRNPAKQKINKGDKI
jgi:hypothetical protein